MKLKTLLLLFSIGLLLYFKGQAQTKFESLNFLYSIQGKQILSGQHNDQKNLECGQSGATGASYWTDQVYSITGKYPGLYSADFLFVGDGQPRWDITYEAEKQWNAGAVVQMMWHSCPPTSGATCGWNPGVISSLSSAQFAELLTNGSNLNNIWKSRVNEIAKYLTYLKNKGVEVFWRPYHEQNQGVFWWNSQGAANTKALWRMMHDYMTNDLGLDNLIWILDVQDIAGATNYWDWNPGNQYWDVMALDVYADAYYNSEYYNNLLTAAGGKPIAIGECFNLPSAQIINTYPQYTFFMNWSYGLKKGLSCENTNSDAFIREVYNNPKVITRDEMPGWGKNKAPENLATNKAITVSSTEAGNNVSGNVNDRNYGTRWSSNYSDNEWISIDLGYTYLLDSIKIRWEAAYASDFQIQVSGDGNNYTTIQNVNNNTSTYNKFIFQKLEANFIRIFGTKRATQWGYSIYEIEAYGKAKALPYNGTLHNVPGVIEAEQFDLGGEGVGYHDLSASNTHLAFRNEGVDIEACTDVNGGFNLAGIQSGEWTNYSINVLQQGFYDFNFRVAATSGGKSFHIEINGVDVSGSIAVPNTAGWQAWQTVNVPSVQLNAGTQNLRLVMDSELFNVNYIEVIDLLSTTIGENASKLDAIIFPNPCRNELHFQLSSDFAEGAQVEVYSMCGQIIFSQKTQNQIGSISLENLSEGIYQIKFSSPSKVVMQSLVVLK